MPQLIKYVLVNNLNTTWYNMFDSLESAKVAHESNKYPGPSFIHIERWIYNELKDKTYSLPTKSEVWKTWNNSDKVWMELPELKYRRGLMNPGDILDLPLLGPARLIKITRLGGKEFLIFEFDREVPPLILRFNQNKKQLEPALANVPPSWYSKKLGLFKGQFQTLISFNGDFR